MHCIGLINEERLKNIPLSKQAAHEFCFFLHDCMARTLVDMEKNGVGDVKFSLESDEDNRLIHQDIHIFDFLERTGRNNIEKRIVINHVTKALYSDMLHFIYEAMIALEKRKFSVAFSLLRKPLKEGVLIAAQICANEEEFFNNIKYDTLKILDYRRLNHVEKRKIITDAISKCHGKSFIDSDKIFDIIYDRLSFSGLGSIFDKATHYITEYKHIRTENYNLNFIFKNPLEDDIYHNIYDKLAIVFLFLNLIFIELIKRMGHTNKKYTNWLIFTSIGSFESLFLKGKPKLVNYVNSHFNTFLVCPNCQSNIKLKKKDAPRLFIGETLDCSQCGFSHHFPFGWLLSKIDFEIFDV